MFKMGKGQAGIEYIMLTAVLLIFLIPTVNYALQTATLNVRLSQLENVVKRVSKAADAVAAGGPGATEIVIITMPSGVVGTYVNNSQILINVSLFGIQPYVVGFTKVNVSGNLPTIAGTYKMYVKAVSNREVLIYQ